MLGLSACAEEDAPFEYRTANLNIATTFDTPLCRGTVRAADQEAQRIQSLLGASADPVDVYLGIEGVRDHCPEWAVGCLMWGKTVYSTLPSLPHELVHAYATPTDLPFLEEGLAEALSGSPWGVARSTVADFQAVALLELLVADYPTENIFDFYQTASHFTTWLISTHGLDALLSWRAAIPPGRDFAAVDAAFMTIYGYSLAAAEIQWKTSAPSEYVTGLGVCAGSPLAWTSANSWSVELALDCDNERTLGPSEYVDNMVTTGMRQNVLLDITHPGEYRLRTESSRDVVLGLKACGCWAGGPGETPGPWSSFGIPAGAVDQLAHLDACRYVMQVVVDDIEPASVVVQLEPEELDDAPP
ncbi:MAG: hypothetical protein HC927_00070 [Deltaproteobacteria bacterium]|nr:hypothetical protein [Deltaproteobacteria bacterium]